MISVYALLLSCGEALIISVFLVPREKSTAESKEPAMALWLRTAGLHGLSLTRFNMYRALAAMLLGLFVAASTGLWNFALLSAAAVCTQNATHIVYRIKVAARRIVFFGESITCPQHN